MANGEKKSISEKIDEYCDTVEIKKLPFAMNSHVIARFFGGSCMTDEEEKDPIIQMNGDIVIYILKKLEI